VRDHRSSRADGEPGVRDRGLRLDPRAVLKLVDHVAVAGQCQACVVTELARDVDDAPSFVQEERRETVA